VRMTTHSRWVILKKNSCKAILNKKNTCNNKLGEKISCPSIWWGKKCCKTAWLQGSIWPVREDQLVWFSGTSARLISYWKTPQNAGNSLSELQKIQYFLGGGDMPPDHMHPTFGGRLSCLRVQVKHGLSCCPRTYTY
jgi:hypothetical protein